MPATGTSSTAIRVEGRSTPSAKRRASMARRLSSRQPRSRAWRPVRRRGGRRRCRRSAAEADAAQEIAHILSGALPIAGTPAERYLAGRGLARARGADLQFHPDLTHWETKTGYPAMLGLVRDRRGDDHRAAPHLSDERR